MSHRRPSRPSPAAPTRRTQTDARNGRRRAAGPAFGGEALEPRRLLTTLTSFGTGALGQQTFTDGTDHAAVIYYFDVDAEVIGAHRGTTATAPNAQLSNLEAYPLPTTTPASTGTDVFKIYVTASAADSYIAITEFSPRVVNGGPFTLTPLAGSIGSVGVADAAGMERAFVPTGNGGILVGGVFFGPSTSTTPREDLTDTLPYGMQIGLQPLQPDGQLNAGIEVIPTNSVTGAQNDFGNMEIGGAVTGHVSFGGNLNQFYAGGIFTGQSTGGSPTQGPTPGSAPTPTTNPSGRIDPGNFSVAGDLRALVTTGEVGTDGLPLPAGEGNNSNDRAILNYVTNVDLTVGGTLGELDVGGDFGGTTEVAHNPVVSGQAAAGTGTTDVVGDTADQTEIEALGPANADQALELAFSGLVANDPSDVWLLGELNIANGTLATAQILGTIPETDPNTGAILRDVNGNELSFASVDGAIDGPPTADAADFYGMAFMAGTTYTVTLTDTADATLSVFDPDGRLIQTNLQASQQAIQVKADKPGIYRFEVAVGGTQDPYNLTIAGTGDLGIGGIVVGGFYDDLVNDGGIALSAGSLGAITVGGAYYSTTLGPTSASTTALAPTFAASSIIVADGDLRTITAATLGEIAPGVTPVIYDDGPVYNIPAGNIGLVQTSGLMDFETQFDPNYLLLNQYKTNTAYAHAISGSVQVVDCGGSLQMFAAIDGGIGTIRAADMATNQASEIDVNADNTGNDGIIDLIDVEGQLGNLGAGGPVITTNTNGDVRYMIVTGPVFLPSAFGATQDQATVSPIGAAATVIDDSGSTFKVTPYGPTTSTVTTTAVTTNADGSTTTTSTTGNTSSGISVVTPAPGTTTRTNSTGPGETQTTVTDALGNETTTVVTGPQVSVLSYPVSDKGGQIPISVSTAGSMTITGTGSNGAASTLDIGTILISGVGRPLGAGGVDPFGNTTVTQPIPATASTSPITTADPATGTSAVKANGANVVISDASLTSAGSVDPTDLFLLLNGSATINAYSIQSAETINFFQGTVGYYGAVDTTTTPGFAAPVVVANRTAGEIVNTNFPSGIGTLQARGNLGFATPVATAAPVYTRGIVANDYPFVQQHTAINLGGSAINVLSNSSIGNVLATGTIQNLVADFGNHPAAGVFAGITGPVEASSLLFVQIGQGLTSSGTGAVGLSGLFATVKIAEVTNGGVPDGDIRGNIVVANNGNTDTPAIDLIQLGNASIVGSTIYDLDYPEYHSANPAVTVGDVFSVGAQVPSADVARLGLLLSQPAGSPIAAGNASDADINSIRITGAGGILSSTIGGGSIGAVNVSRNGFGVIDATLTANPAGRVFGITAGGYGVRGVDIDNGGYVGPINATGNGSLLPVTAFPLDLRPSDVSGAAFDPFTGNPLSDLNDLNDALGGSVSAATPNVANVTDTGVVEDLLVSALYDVSGIAAQTLRTSLPVASTSVAPTPAQANIPIVGTPFANSITTSGTVGSIRVRGLIDGFQITAGSVGQFTQGGSVNRLGIDVAGSIANLNVRGNLGTIITDPATGDAIPDSYIYANGTSSHIDKLSVAGNLYANVFSSKYIGSINIAGNLDGNVTIQGVSPRNLALTSMTIGGSIASGSLNIAGAVGTITTGGSLGVAGQALAIAGPVKKLVVGSPKSAATNALALDLTVYGNVGQVVVNGRITGSVHVLNDLQSLTVNDGNPADAALSGAITVEGKLTRATINNGNVASAVSAIGGISTFTINRGSLLSTGSISSTLGSIASVRVLGGTAYGIDGSIAAANGQGLNVTTTGSLGDGTDVATIMALTGGTISVAGNVESNATVSIAGLLNSLIVGGTVQAGGTVSGHPIKTVRIGTAPAGTVVAS